ncbi:MAG: hypothetical protein HY270_16485 [Deltaproteobacteria bacterium]|nr:hypothetical protein [Deltaproteobacteria bacterium]
MEFVKVKYPRQRRVLLDGEDFEDTNTTFEVERGTHTFAIDEPTAEGPQTKFIELTSQQSPRVLTFTPVSAKKTKPVGRRVRAAKPATKKKAVTTKAVTKKGPAKKGTRK